jgi:hypothetical protein
MSMRQIQHAVCTHHLTPKRCHWCVRLQVVVIGIGCSGHADYMVHTRMVGSRSENGWELGVRVGGIRKRAHLTTTARCISFT